MGALADLLANTPDPAERHRLKAEAMAALSDMRGRSIKRGAFTVTLSDGPWMVVARSFDFDITADFQPLVIGEAGGVQTRRLPFSVAVRLVDDDPAVLFARARPGPTLMLRVPVIDSVGDITQQRVVIPILSAVPVNTVGYRSGWGVEIGLTIKRAGKDVTPQNLSPLRIWNPPILVDDPAGDIVQTSTDPDGKVTTRQLKEDLRAAMLSIVKDLARQRLG